jgi:hypothetical protein
VFVPSGVVLFGLDDTIERRRGDQTDLPPHFGQATPYNSLVLLILEDRKTRGVSAYILCKLLAWGKGVPNASRIAF